MLKQKSTQKINLHDIRNNLILNIGNPSYKKAEVDAHRLDVYFKNKLCEVNPGESILNRFYENLRNPKLAFNLALLTHQDGLLSFFAFSNEALKSAIMENTQFTSDDKLGYLAEFFSPHGKFRKYAIRIDEISENEIKFRATAVNPMSGETLFELSLDVSYQALPNNVIEFSDPQFRVCDAAKKLGLANEFDIPAEILEYDLKEKMIKIDKPINSVICPATLTIEDIDINLETLETLPLFDKLIFEEKLKDYYFEKISKIIGVNSQSFDEAYDAFYDLKVLPTVDTQDKVLLIAHFIHERLSMKDRSDLLNKLIQLISNKSSFVLSQDPADLSKYVFILKIVMHVALKEQLTRAEIKKAIEDKLPRLKIDNNVELFPLLLEGSSQEILIADKEKLIDIKDKQWHEWKREKLATIKKLAKFELHTHLLMRTKLNEENEKLLSEKNNVVEQLEQIELQLLPNQIEELKSKQYDLLVYHLTSRSISRKDMYDDPQMLTSLINKNNDSVCQQNEEFGEREKGLQNKCYQDIKNLKDNSTGEQAFYTQVQQLRNNTASRLKEIDRSIEIKKTTLNQLQQKYPHDVQDKLVFGSPKPGEKNKARLNAQKEECQSHLVCLEAQINEKAYQINLHTAAYYAQDSKCLKISVSEAVTQLGIVEVAYKQFKKDVLNSEENFTDLFRTNIDDKHREQVELNKYAYLSILERLAYSEQDTKAERAAVKAIFAAAKGSEIVNTHVNNYTWVHRLFFNTTSKLKIDALEEKFVHFSPQMRYGG